MSGDRPDARELIEAVAQWLTNELAPGVDAGPRFQAMVAAQGLAIAARELALAAEHAALDRAAFATLVDASRDAELEELRRAVAKEIAAGRYDEDLGRVAVVLREHVRRKLAIARPGYDRSGR